LRSCCISSTRVEVQGTSRIRLELAVIADVRALKIVAGAVVHGTRAEAEAIAADTLNLAKSPVSELSKAERTMACEVKEVVASPSANETLLVVDEAEVVENDTEIDDDLLLLLASQTTALSAIVGSETDESPPSTAAFFTSKATQACLFWGILTGFDGIMIRCLGSGEGTRTSA